MSNIQEPNLETPPQVHWGGPDRQPRFLRDILEAHIHAVPKGGEIFWVTYYFRDESLAQALQQASRRGVKVRVALEKNPRNSKINRQVIKTLSGSDALGKGLRAITHRFIDNRFLRGCRLHEKLYFFSHPKPCVLLGTFNPSGNTPENREVIRGIGDQDRGHNVLVEFHDPELVKELRSHALRIFKMTHGPWERFLPENNRVVVSGPTQLRFFPRTRSDQFDDLFTGLGKDSTLRIAASHLNDPGVCKRLFDLRLRNGVHIEILAHDTERRVPSWVEKKMIENGVIFIRYINPEALPMHNKFMLIETPHRQVLAFGSMNLSVRSLHANHELLVIDVSPVLYNEFRKRWDEMLNEVKNN